ncbi:phage collar protein [Vibrio harveyi]|uniref:phage collar protein n=1 Tax=Vibrio harveyi TaxID=669 RepID=UPI000C7CD9F6|nr:hypothetical protein [Vibrio harveyi]AWB00246.1 hypothetical protein CU052_13490 [Vibrio harveyi]GBK97743.1 hypothetical protein VH1709_contig00011-0071 [Vibrio harveyi]HDM8061699.1 hypothetical protein [Vibrio harveyi]
MSTNFPFNVLAAAQTVIRTQEIEVRRFSGRKANAAGLLESMYEQPVTINCSVQPVKRTAYKKMGLDFNKTYVSILAVEDIKDLARDRSGDQVVIQGSLFETVGESDWTMPAGWNRILAVKVGKA